MDGLPRRIADKIMPEPNSGCWLWDAANDGRYGVVWYDGRQVGVHRLMYALFVADIGPGAVIHHRCGTKLCCNPDHLERLNHGEHAAEHDDVGAPAFQRSKTECPQGHEYDEANTGVRDDGSRYCRACARERMRARKAALRV